MVSPQADPTPHVSAVLFDVAGTLLWKPDLVPAIREVLGRHGAVVDEQAIAIRHKLLSEIIDFPDQTSATFYAEFNGALLRSLGIPASVKLSADVYDACKDLPWVAYDDAGALSSLSVPLGIVSNWDDSLDDALRLIGIDFDVVVGSSTAKVRKPNSSIFLIAAKRLDLPPDAMAYVGDSVRLDVEPALAVGMRTVLVDRLGIFPAHQGSRTGDLTSLPALLHTSQSHEPSG